GHPAGGKQTGSFFGGHKSKKGKKGKKGGGCHGVAPFPGFSAFSAREVVFRAPAPPCLGGRGNSSLSPPQAPRAAHRTRESGLDRTTTVRVRRRNGTPPAPPRSAPSCLTVASHGSGAIHIPAARCDASGQGRHCGWCSYRACGNRQGWQDHHNCVLGRTQQGRPTNGTAFEAAALRAGVC